MLEPPVIHGKGPGGGGIGALCSKVGGLGQSIQLTSLTAFVCDVCGGVYREVGEGGCWDGGPNRGSFGSVAIAQAARFEDCDMSPTSLTLLHNLTPMSHVGGLFCSPLRRLPL